MHNNTCKWKNEDDSNSFKSGMPYVMHVKANNSLGSVFSELYRAETLKIGTCTCCLGVFVLILLLLSIFV